MKRTKRTFFLAKAEFWSPGDPEYPGQNQDNVHLCWSDRIVPKVGCKLEQLLEGNPTCWNSQNVADKYPVEVIAVFNDKAGALLDIIQRLFQFGPFGPENGVWDAVHQMLRIAVSSSQRVEP